MPQYFLQDLDVHDRLIKEYPLAETSLDTAIAAARQRMKSHWSEGTPLGPVLAVLVVDENREEKFRWSWPDEQNEYQQRMICPYHIITRVPGNPEIDPEQKVVTDIRFHRAQLDKAIAKAKEIMADEADKHGRQTDLLAVEVWDESEVSVEPKFRYTREDHFKLK